MTPPSDAASAPVEPAADPPSEGVADTEGRVYGGPFVAGANTVCVTFEVTLEEWLPADDND